MRYVMLVLAAACAFARPLAAQNQQPLIIVDGVKQPQGPQAAAQPADPFARFFYPPELVMQHQTEIALTDTQRASLLSMMQQAQGKFVEVQFKLAGEGGKLARLLQGATVDETQTLEAVDRVLALERELKRAQVGLMVRIKNVLTTQQQARLNDLRRS